MDDVDFDEYLKSRKSLKREIQEKCINDKTFISEYIDEVGVENFLKDYLHDYISQSILEYVFEDFDVIYDQAEFIANYKIKDTIKKLIEYHMSTMINIGDINMEFIKFYIIENLSEDKLEDLYKIMEVVPKHRVLLEDV